MKNLLLTLALILTLTGSVVAQTFPLDPAQWLIDPQQADQGTAFTKKGTLAFWFPSYATTPDSYAGYLLLPWISALSGSTFTATVQVITFPVSPDKPVRFIAPYNGGCLSEGRVYIFFQTNTLYNGIDGTQWWASADSWAINDTGTATVTISAPLNDPSRWASVYAHSGTDLPAEFANAKSNPTYVGLTFGGNCANGHGLQTRKGDAQFRLVNFNVQ